MGKIWIVFFALLAFWLLWKSVVLPLCGQRVKQEMAEWIGLMTTALLLGISIALIVVLLHFLGVGFLELMKPFGEVFRR